MPVGDSQDSTLHLADHSDADRPVRRWWSLSESSGAGIETRATHHWFESRAIGAIPKPVFGDALQPARTT